LHTESITGTSTSTPTTVANAAPEPGPNSVIATATASSKKLLAPINAPGAPTIGVNALSMVRSASGRWSLLLLPRRAMT
jgi:hypothetical protein